MSLTDVLEYVDNRGGDVPVADLEARGVTSADLEALSFQGTLSRQNGRVRLTDAGAAAIEAGGGSGPARKRPALKPKACARCGGEFQPKAPAAKYCPDCAGTPKAPKKRRPAPRSQPKATSAVYGIVLDALAKLHARRSELEPALAEARRIDTLIDHLNEAG